MNSARVTVSAVISFLRQTRTTEFASAFVPEAITMATADLELPKGVHEAARENYDGISLRMVTAYNIATDQYITRLDILYGSLFIRPEWCVAVADAV